MVQSIFLPPASPSSNRRAVRVERRAGSGAGDGHGSLFNAGLPRLLGTPGFSDKLLKQHFDLYAGYVKNANALHDELAASSPAKPPTPSWSELKRRSDGNGTVCASTRSTLEI